MGGTDGPQGRRQQDFKLSGRKLEHEGRTRSQIIDVGPEAIVVHHRLRMDDFFIKKKVTKLSV